MDRGQEWIDARGRHGLLLASAALCLWYLWPFLRMLAGVYEHVPDHSHGYFVPLSFPASSSTSSGRFGTRYPSGRTRVDPPADIILGSDGTGLNHHMWWPSATPWYGGPAPGSWYEDPLYHTRGAPYARHLGTCNFLFNDGSVLRELIKKYWYDEYWTY